MMRYQALVPVKTLTEAKSRLAAYLSASERETLVLDMLYHVLGVLRKSELLEQITVVSPDERVLEHALVWGAQAMLEEEQGHNPALHAAALRARAAGTKALLTISADLPLLTAQDIRGMIARSARHPIVLAPSREGTGTNALLARPPLAVPYLFGPHSFQDYVQAARQRQLSVSIYNSMSLAWDIDNIDDIDELRNHGLREYHELTTYNL